MQEVKKPKKPLIIYYLLALLILALLNRSVFPQFMKPDVKTVEYSIFLDKIQKKDVAKVQIEGDTIYFTDKEDRKSTRLNSSH